MGVHGLWRLLDTFGEVTRPDDWRGKRVAIDASIWMSQFRAQCAAGENVEQRILEGFFLRILKLLFYGIEPVFVFDGSAAPLKSMERRRRAERRAALERAALTRRAKQIVKAQLASGVLDVQALDRQSPVKKSGDHLSSSKRRDAPMVRYLSSRRLPVTATEGCGALPRRLMHKRPREVVLEPDVVSRTLTKNFLNEAEEWMEEKRRGEMCIEANTLLYSSTSLFMGPRRVLEGKIDEFMVPDAQLENDKKPSQHMSLSFPTRRPPSVVISDDETTGNNDWETVSTGTGDGDSVVVVEGDKGTFVSRLHEMEEVMSQSLHEDSCDTWSEKTMMGSDDGILSSCGKGGCIRARSTSSSAPDDSALLWNPGTQLNCQKGSETTNIQREVSEEGSGQFTPVSLHPVEWQTSEETSTLVTKELEGALGATTSVVASSFSYPSHVPASNPKPSTASSMAAAGSTVIKSNTNVKQVIPFELLEIVELLECCGIPFVISPHEADAQCAFLSQHRLVDAVFSEDSDVIVHGAAVVLRGFFAKDRYVVAYRQCDLATCGVDKDVLVALALLLGCDYAEGVDGVSLLEALQIITAFWRQESDQGPLHVLEMLTQWRNAVVQRCFVWDDESTLLQYYLNWRKWASLRVTMEFPKADVVDAFFNATVETDLRSFAAASPDWKRLRTFAGMHGLLGSITCQQRLELAQKEFTARELQRQDVHQRQQLRLTDFAMSSQIKKVIYRKQPPRFAAALSALRVVRRGGVILDG
ncbi:putative DNA repair protein RAD2 [Trypanosoma rangeli]|uniref:Putative DNA repair protein RAD2 n=1 Tax=Trypanosoma rangeli TaxID=5698 RepID=A0A3R7KHT9_TRYRA|nr:putative DNA repair protein RAD2 [Trypanosoma rangeli]RNF07934.1 putative DNA repair protein RAD2 [Trypanosoma rangeli]|eukprot:RNF07934.1 putative DNA repair protein RAD2 [Trypanosoma rangeli]